MAGESGPSCGPADGGDPEPLWLELELMLLPLIVTVIPCARRQSAKATSFWAFGVPPVEGEPSELLGELPHAAVSRTMPAMTARAAIRGQRTLRFLALLMASTLPRGCRPCRHTGEPNRRSYGRGSTARAPGGLIPGYDTPERDDRAPPAA
jgi:hypothetical protein